MNDNIKTPGLINPESYVLTHNRFNNNMVLVFSDLNKAQIYKMPYRIAPYQDIRMVVSFDHLNVFTPNNENFLLEVGNKIYIYVGEKAVTFNLNDKILRYDSQDGFNDIKYAHAYSEENKYFMLHQKYIPIREYEQSTQKSEYEY